MEAIKTGVQGPVIPAMTSNTTPYGVVSSPNSPTIAYKVFDRDDSTCWFSNDSASDTYIQYRFDAKHRISRVEILHGPHSVSSACVGRSCTFVLQGSNDGTSWQDISDIYTINFGDTKKQMVCYTHNPDMPYLYFRMQFKSGSSLGVPGSYGYSLYGIAVYST